MPRAIPIVPRDIRVCWHRQEEPLSRRSGREKRITEREGRELKPSLNKSVPNVQTDRYSIVLITTRVVERGMAEKSGRRGGGEGESRRSRKIAARETRKKKKWKCHPRSITVYLVTATRLLILVAFVEACFWKVALGTSPTTMLPAFLATEHRNRFVCEAFVTARTMRLMLLTENSC